jgi:hypothetical protein
MLRGGGPLWHQNPDDDVTQSISPSAVRWVYKERKCPLQALGVRYLRESLSIEVHMSVLKLRGFEIHKELLNYAAQKELVKVVRDIAKAAPVFSPMTPYGKPMTVKMTSAGTYGWYSDAKGYEYRRSHPKGMAWPEIPPQIMNIWQSVSGVQRMPECCLVNFGEHLIFLCRFACQLKGRRGTETCTPERFCSEALCVWCGIS